MRTKRNNYLNLNLSHENNNIIMICRLNSQRFMREKY